MSNEKNDNNSPNLPVSSSAFRSFGDTINELKAGRIARATRLGWNGRDMYIALQKPDANSKMSLPYIYMKTADNNLVPWIASQTDMLADDWVNYLSEDVYVAEKREKESQRVTTSGRPPTLPDTASAPEPVDPKTGQHGAYWVLSEEERKVGRVRPLRLSYKHTVCGVETRMGVAIAETYTKDPSYYGATFCAYCKTHLPIGKDGDFVWEDGSKVGT